MLELIIIAVYFVVMITVGLMSRRKARGVDEFFVDPMQPYADSMVAFSEAFGNNEQWNDIYAIMSNKKVYKEI